MKRRAKYSLIVVLVVILGVGFGIWKMFFAPKPLKIKDLEDMHIVITKGSGAHVWQYVILSIVDEERGERRIPFGYIYDNEHIYREERHCPTSSPIPVAVQLYVEQGDAKSDIQAGDTLEITYDGGQVLTIYLPFMEHLGNVVEGLTLYPATDGSTYYNKRLTQLAQAAPPKPGEEVKNE